MLLIPIVLVTVISLCALVHVDEYRKTKSPKRIRRTGYQKHNMKQLLHEVLVAAASCPSTKYLSPNLPITPNHTSHRGPFRRRSHPTPLAAVELPASR